MLVLILLVIGFLITDGALGAQIIGAFDLAQYLFLIVAAVVSLLSVVILAGSVWKGSELTENKLIGGLLGGGLGSIIVVIMLMFSYTQVWLSYFIIDNIDPSTTELAMLSSDVKIAIAASIIIALMGTITTKMKGN